MTVFHLDTEFLVFCDYYSFYRQAAININSSLFSCTKLKTLSISSTILYSMTWHAMCYIIISEYIIMEILFGSVL